MGSRLDAKLRKLRLSLKHELVTHISKIRLYIYIYIYILILHCLSNEKLFDN